MKLAKNLFYILLVVGFASLLGFSQTQTTCIMIPVAPVAPKTNNIISDATTSIGAGDWVLDAKTAAPKSLTVNNTLKVPTNIFVQSGQLLTINVLNSTSTLNIYVLAGGSLSFASTFTLPSAVSIYNYGNISTLGDFLVNGKLLNAAYSEFDASANMLRITSEGKVVNNGVILSKDLQIMPELPAAICIGANSCITTSSFSINNMSNSIQTNYTGTTEFGHINVTEKATQLNSPITSFANVKVCLVEASNLYGTKNWGNAVVEVSCKSPFCAKGLKELVDPNKGGSQTACLNTRPSSIKYQVASGGNGQMIYQWQSSTDNRIWADINGATTQDFTPPILTQTTYFRRKTTSTFVVYSGVHTVNVLPAFTPANNTITSEGNLYCGSQVQLNGSDVYQYEDLFNTNYSITYNWLYSTNKTGPWLSTGSNEFSYLVSNINSTTYYRRAVLSNGRCNVDTSDAVEINIGNPLIVTRTDDDSDLIKCGMLRYALGYANDNVGVDVISFNLPAPSTISLVSSIYIGENIVLKGPGKDKLIIKGSDFSGIFYFNDDQISARLEAAGDTSTFSGMTFTGANESALTFYSSNSSLIVRNCDFIKNTATQNGAGINFNAEGLLIDSCLFQDNTSGAGFRGGNGAGAYIYSYTGFVKISNSLFVNNTGVTNPNGVGIGNGNGLYIGGSSRIENTSFYKNTSDNGGGMYIDQELGDSTVIVNSTFSGNKAQYGGGIHSAKKLRLYNTTVTANEATAYGGGLAVFNGDVRIKNTIIAQNTGKLSNDIFAETGLVVSNGNNFIGVANDTQGNPIWNATTDLLGTTQSPLQAKLATLDLSNYTHTPLVGSPVIDKATTYSGVPKFDQLGALRNQGKGIDIGSVESAPFTFSAGNDTIMCDSVLTLKATTAPRGYVGAWSTIAADRGKATINNAALAITSAKILKSDTVRFVWSLADQAGTVLTRDTVRVIRRAIPAKPTVGASVTYCQNVQAALLTATGTNLKWYSVAAGGTVLANTPTPSTANIGSVNYFVSQTTGICESQRAVIVVTINATPLAPTVSTPVTYCQNAIAAPLTATGTNLKWYTLATGGTELTNTPTPSTASVGNVNYYVSQSNGVCESPRAILTVTTNATPFAPTISTPVIYCQNATASQLTATGTNLKWYTVATAGNALTAAPTPLTTSVGSVNYFVSQTAGICESPRANIVVTTNATPTAPTVSASVTYCQNITASPLTATGANLKWYTVAIGGNASTIAPTPPTIVVQNTNYYVSQTTGACEGPRATITVVTNSTPAAPLVTSPVTYCQNTTATTLTATGSNLKWYASATSGTVLTSVPTPSTANVGSVNYFVSQSTGVCESPRATITVVTNSTPSAPLVTTPVTYCQNATATALSAIGTNLKWYTVGTAGTALSATPTPLTTAVGNTSYYVSQTAGVCESSRSLISVRINEKPDTPIITGACVTPVPPANLSTQYANEAFDTRWLRNDILVNTSRSHSADVVGIYKAFAIRKSTGCVSDTSAGVDPFITTPKITLIGSNPFCAGDSVRVSSSSVQGNTWKQGVNTFPALQNIVIKSAGKLVLQVTGGNCPGKDSVVFSTNASPVIPIITSIADSACAGGFMRLSTVSNATLQWILNGFPIKDSTKTSLHATTSGSYQVQAKLGTCSSISAIKNIGFKPLPTKPILSLVGSQTICNGDSLSIGVSNYANGLDTWYKNGSAIVGTNSLKLKTAGVYNIVRTNKGCISSSDTLNLEVNFCTIAAYAGANQTVCVDTTNLAAGAIQGYTGVWTSIKGNAKISNPTLPNTKVTGLAKDTNMFVWTLKQNGQDAGKDTVLIMNNSIIADAGEYINTCDSSATLKATPVKIGESGTWTSLGNAKVSNSTLFNTSVTNLVPFDTINEANKFVWTVRKQSCVNRDTALVFYAKALITVDDDTSGIAGQDILVKVTRNDRYSLGDKLIVTALDSVGLGTPIISYDIINDTLLRFRTNPRLYVTDKPYYFRYNLSNLCNANSIGRIVLVKTKNERPTPGVFEKTTTSGIEYSFDLPLSEIDGNPNINSFRIEAATSLGGKPTVGFSLDSLFLMIKIDYTAVPDYEGLDYLLLRVCDTDENGIDSCVFQTFNILVKSKGSDIEVYNALSPNGDGKHDFLEIKNIELAKENTINIFNRWGDKVYSATNYDNDKVVFDGENLPDGTYYYVFEPKGDRKLLEGFILLKR